MTENQNGDAGAQNGSESQDVDPVLPDIDPENVDSAKVEELSKAAKTAIAQKKHWREKAIDPETGRPFKDLLAEARKTLPPKEEKPAPQDETLKKNVDQLMSAEEKRQFGHAHGLSPEETDHVFAYASGTGIKPVEALEKPFLKNALAAARGEARITGATPRPSSRQPLVEGKSFAEMNTDEKRKHFSKFAEAVSRNKRS